MKNDKEIVKDECCIIGNILNRKEKTLSKDITEEERKETEKRLEYNRQFYKKYEPQIKERRRKKFIEQLRKKFERIKLITPNPPSRKCPSCGLELYYVNIGNRNRSEKSGALCNSCKFYGTKNPAYRHIPHNKGKYFRTEKERKILNRYRQLKINFVITEKEYVDMFNLQQGKCKICNTHRNELNENLCVDHCHKSNKIRGLLCRKCNAGLGIFKDNTDIINSALKYLQSYQ